MARVTLEQVNKIYSSRHGPVHAVQDLDMMIEDGEFVALLGPSGCGKTSTLRMIVGLEPITGGTIRFDDQVVNDLTPEQRNVAMAFESYALYPNFTIAENLGFPLEVRGVNTKERRAEVERIAALLRIEDLLEQKPGQLSGGQQQRVSLGRALIRAPAVFILDEVMSHLDAHLKFQMLFELKRVHQQLNRTMVYVTHDQMEALALADRVAVMSEARLQQFATRGELYEQPVNRFVADFIGEPPTNFLEVDVTGEGDEVFLTSVDGGLRFRADPVRHAALAAQGLTRLILGIRPQNLSVVPREMNESLELSVLLNEYQGEMSIVTAAAGQAELRAIVPASFDAGPGQPLRLHYQLKDVMLFHPETEAFIG